MDSKYFKKKLLRDQIFISTYSEKRLASSQNFESIHCETPSTYMGAAIQIRVYDNKLSIWNEGVLHLGLNIEGLKVEHNSRPRNPKIADACFKSSYIDAWGIGILKIINSCKDAKLPEPEIIEKDGGIQVTIYKAIDGRQSPIVYLVNFLRKPNFV